MAKSHKTPIKTRGDNTTKSDKTSKSTKSQKSLKLSDEQRQVLNKLWQWLKQNSSTGNYITLGGYAGTGKTTCLGVFRRYLNEALPDWKIAFASYTGKASRVLLTSLRQSKAHYKDDFVGTLHSLLYAPVVGKNQQIISWDLKKTLPYNLIIIDEASMVDQNLWKDVRSFNIPIIAVGDHGQLPPIHGSFNLMDKPVLKLETIHRQAAENPIIKLSQLARTEGKIPTGVYDERVKKFSNSDYQTQEFVDEQMQRFSTDMLVLCGYNHTRVQLNNAIRLALGFDSSEPQPKDRVICLRNNRDKDIYNGMLGTIQHINKEGENWYYAEIELDGESRLYSGLIAADQFHAKQTLDRQELFLDKKSSDDLLEKSSQKKKTSKNTNKKTKNRDIADVFDFGYAITVHKAQGSQAKKVLLFEERFKQMDDQAWRRWLYTAVTRAEEELYIVGS